VTVRRAFELDASNMGESVGERAEATVQWHWRCRDLGLRTVGGDHSAPSAATREDVGWVDRFAIDVEAAIQLTEVDALSGSVYDVLVLDPDVSTSYPELRARIGQ
jgi:hypothetical protein